MNRLFTFLLVVSVQLSEAQTWQFHNPTFGFDVNTLDILGPGVIVLGGGQEALDSFQIMFRTDNYGQSWTENEHDGLAPWNKSIAFSDPMNGFGAGYDGRIIKTDDGGLHWGNAVNPVNRDFNKIINIDALTYVAAGGNQSNDSIQTIVKTTDGGANWLVMYDQAGPWLRSLFFTDALKGIAVGDGGVILSTADGGSVWTAVTPPIQRDFNGITFLNADTGYIVGGNASGNRTMLRTDNGGATWSVVMDTIGGALNDLSFANSLTGYAVGDSATVLKTTDGGISWTAEVVDVNLTGNEQFRAVKFYDENFGAIAGKAGVFYLYNLPPPYSTFQTLQVSASSFTTATLSGVVDSITVPMNLFFEYDTTLAFLNSVVATPALVNDTLPHSVSAYVNDLHPNMVYYYRLKGISGTDTYYGNTLTFFSASSGNDNTFKTEYATEVTDTSAILTGSVNGFYFQTPVQISFQYGTTEAFGRETVSGDVNVDDTLSHPVSVFISGLSPDTVFYYYRLKVVAGTNTYYGNTKKLYTGLPEIPNWNFTHWQNDVTELPTEWKVIFEDPEKVPGHTGNAVKLSGKNILILGAYKNKLPDQEPSGPNFFDGIPFPYRPDSVSFYLNYYVEPGDTAIFFIYLYSSNDTVAFRFLPITGNSAGVFVRKAFAIPYSSSLTPDSMVVAFTSSKPEDTGQANENNYLIIDDISFGTGLPLLPNHDFEDWFFYSVNKLLLWEYSRFITANEPEDAPMAEQTFFSEPDDYALDLHNVLIANTVTDAKLTTNSMGPFHEDGIGFALAGKHMTLNGYYKYFPVNGDTVFIVADLVKNGETVGWGALMQSDSVTDFTPFDINIYYPDSTLIPDSATIKISPYREPSRGLSRLIVDKLTFDGFRINVVDTLTPGIATAAETELKIYPNPTRDLITIELNDAAAMQAGIVQLYNFSGQLLKEISVRNAENRLSFSVAEMAAGIYLLKWLSGNTAINKKIIVLE